MLAPLNQLIAALRDELQQYGEMLALLDQQQEYVMQRATQPLLESVAAVDSQGVRIREARANRDQCQAVVATERGLSAASTFSQLIEVLPEDYRPLLQALVQENNELLFRVQQRARQNHLLLTRSLEMMQRFLSTIFSATTPTVYTGQGVVPTQAPAQALYEAVG